MRFYSFIAQVMRLEDTGLEKLYSYAAWLVAPAAQPRSAAGDRDHRRHAAPAGIQGGAEGAGQRLAVAGRQRPRSKAISEFGAKPYTEDEKKELSEIVKAFNERHGTEFTEADMIRFEQVNREIMDEDMTEMLRNNPPDVVYAAFSQAFFQGAIRMFQRDNEMRNIVLTDAEARDKATRHFFNRALREVRQGTEGAADRP